MLASRALAAVAAHADAWPAVHVHHITPHALDFIARSGCGVVSVAPADARAAAQFADALFERGLHHTLRHLTVRLREVRFQRRHTFFAALADLPALEVLNITCEAVLVPTGVALGNGEGLRRLRSLKISEEPDANGERRMEVYLDRAELPALERVVLHVNTSDVLAHAWRFPHLRHVVYNNDRDTFEDARLDGCTLTYLETDVANDAAMTYLTSAVAHAAAVHRLALGCMDDAVLTSRMPVRELVLHMCELVTVDLDFAVVSTLERFRVEALDMSANWAVRLQHVGAFDRFLMWTRRTDAFVDQGGQLTVAT
jgi:hypothetical protein